jgi:hypothetical protein
MKLSVMVPGLVIMATFCEKIREGLLPEIVHEVSPVLKPVPLTVTLVPVGPIGGEREMLVEILITGI